MRTTYPHTFYFIIFLLLFFSSCSDQTEPQRNIQKLPATQITFNDLDGFKEPEAGNWQIVGNLYADRKVKHHFETVAGIGVLVNLPNDNQRADLYSSFDHGDLELETEFMMPKGSNSGLYFQGRYEVQLLDSWGVQDLRFADCGAIYQRWDEATQSGYEGSAPKINASRAPGLWQHLKVSFQAPRFDENGKKISNARFLEVYLNGTLVQENVEVSGPTRSAFFDDEAPRGPLVIQGDHGPVAFRNMQYKIYESDRVRLADMEYALFQGEYDSFDTLSSLEPTKSGTTDSLTYQAAGDYDRYAIQFRGIMEVPTDGTYLFRLAGYGPATLEIEEKIITSNDMAQNIRDEGIGSVDLKEGAYPFTLSFLKNNRPWQKGLSLVYEGPGIPESRLHARNSVPEPQQVDPILVIADEETALQRGFFMHKGKKYTHTVLVGSPHQINYAHEIKNGALLAGWRGHFADATDMWHSRGAAQLAKPLGSQVDFSAKPLIANLNSTEDPWPDSVNLEDDAFRYKGYQLHASGLPVYRYMTQHAEVTDMILPDTNQHSLIREIHVNFDEPLRQQYALLAEGETIEPLPDGSYAVDDKSYYVEPHEMGTGQPMIKSDGDQQQLIVPLVSAESPLVVKYGIIW
jgi:hypothetical protein